MKKNSATRKRLVKMIWIESAVFMHGFMQDYAIVGGGEVRVTPYDGMIAREYGLEYP